MRRSVAIALAIATASCTYGENGCRALNDLTEGYNTVPLTLSWSGSTMDRPNLTRPGCNLPLSDVIISHDTVDMLARRLLDNKLREGRLSFESEVDAFLYVSSDKVFVVHFDFSES